MTDLVDDVKNNCRFHPCWVDNDGKFRIGFPKMTIKDCEDFLDARSSTKLKRPDKAHFIKRTIVQFEERRVL